MKKTNILMAIALSVGVALPGASLAKTVTFDDAAGGIGEGTIANNTVFGGIVSVSSPDETNAPAALFNSNCFGSSCSGGDRDLATGAPFNTDPQGLVLVIEENPGKAGVDDDARGGTLDFSFLKPVMFNSITLLDLDRNFTDIMFTFLFGDGSSSTTGLPSAVTLLSPGVTGDNSLRQYDFSGLENVVGMSFFTEDSGAIASFDVTPVPLPAGLPLLLAGLGGLAYLKRRKATAAA